MELYEYLAIIRRRWLLLVAFVLVFGVGFGSYGSTRPASFDAVTTLSLVKKMEPTATSASATTYQFDNYYTLQSGQLMSEILLGWLTDPTLVKAVYDAAAVPISTGTVSGYHDLIKAKRLSGATVEITTSAGTAAEAERLASAARDVVAARLQILIDQGTIGPITVFDAPVLSQPHPGQKNILIAIGVILGSLLGLVFMFFLEYAKPHRS